MKKHHLFLGTILLLTACQPNLNYPTDSDNSKNLNSLTTLIVGESTIYLQDIIMNPADIDSITSSSAKLDCKIDSNKMTATFDVQKGMEHFVDVKLWIKGIPYSIPCRKTDKIDYSFSFDPQGKTYQKVQIAGQMNDWSTSKTPDLKLNDKGLFEVALYLSPGTYLYQLSLDGEQNHNPSNPNKVDNGYTATQKNKEGKIK